jgi:hypothetical protein
MTSSRPATLLVIGEGKTEEGDSFLERGSPGDPIPDDELGALHVLVERVLVERCGVEPLFVWPPGIRHNRRPGNPGLLKDLAGEPRRPPRPPVTGSVEDRVRRKPWLSACVGRLAVDLVVVVKDANQPRMADRTRERLRESYEGSLRVGLDVIAGAATPSIEGWLLPIDEGQKMDEKAAKRLLSEGRLGSIERKVERAREIALDKIVRASPTGFAPLVAEIEAWAGSFRRG